MRAYARVATVLLMAVATHDPSPVSAQAEPGPGMQMTADHHEMWHTSVGGWTFSGMAQAFPVVTIGDPGGEADSPLRRTEAYLTQAAAMMNVESPGSRLVLRTTLDFEGVTLEDGELTFGGWGEGFIDKRHPHTLLHEMMLSVNLWAGDGSAFSLSAGKGFAPYGTDDPMSRPGLKYPTNHHLSQILERWTVNGVVRVGGWSLEAGVFGGAEPEDPYDLSNIDSFGDSWSGRVGWRRGAASAPRWEASASFGHVVEDHDGESEATRLWNANARHTGPLGSGELYALVEASRSDPEQGDGFYSVLAEGRYELGSHQPYARLEYATRPEYARASSAVPGFFRYEAHDDPIGSTGWLITTVAYAYQVTPAPWSVRPFVEVQHHGVRDGRGTVTPEGLFGSRSFWTVSLGARLYLGGNPMRMGSYGVLDPMTEMLRSMSAMPGMR